MVPCYKADISPQNILAVFMYSDVYMYLLRIDLLTNIATIKLIVINNFQDQLQYFSKVFKVLHSLLIVIFLTASYSTVMINFVYLVVAFIQYLQAYPFRLILFLYVNVIFIKKVLIQKIYLFDRESDIKNLTRIGIQKPKRQEKKEYIAKIY